MGIIQFPLFIYLFMVYLMTLSIAQIILSRIWVTTDGVRIDNWVYWPFTNRDCK
jgi:hypothetical protein